MAVTKCECQGPGWCARHGCTKSELHYDLCRTHAGFFEKWESGQGAGQLSAGDPHSRFVVPCQHLGSVVRTAPCEGCRGMVQIKVYACSLHERCALGTSLPDVHSCFTCEDYASSLPAPNLSQ